VAGSSRWRGAIAGGGEQSQVEGSNRRLRGAIAGGRERSQLEGSNRRWRVALPSTYDRSPPPTIAPLCSSYDRSPPPRICSLHLRSLSYTCHGDHSPPPANMERL
jgi:hypothetical protein